jgi:phosphate:Na+ symporter
MNYGLYDFLVLIGSLGLFLYGMKIMSEGLQQAAGDKLRSILTAMTKNRFMGVLTGLLVTSIIQSSSATTVMVVSFVNAGLLTLLQSVTVIMGANIGTTITAWIISFFGFKFSIATISIPLIALSIPFVFSAKGKRKSIGDFILGFALLFLGLDMLKNAVPDLKSNPEMLEFLKHFTNLGYGSVFIFLIIGTLLTIVVQSSSATMALTLVMVAKGWITYELGAAMVLGENIGTTITANLAAIPANNSAKRAALAHTIFNVFGVIWMMFIFHHFLDMITWLTDLLGLGNPTNFSNEIMNSPENQTIINAKPETLSDSQLLLQTKLLNDQAAASYGLSLFHSAFNLVNTFVLIWFAKLITKTVKLIIRKDSTDEEFQLQYISTGMLSTSELSLMQAWNEIKTYSKRTQKMFEITQKLLNEKNENEAVKLFSKIQKYESISDRIEVEIANYLTKVADGSLSDKSKHQIQKMLRVISEIESVSDGCHNIARTIMRKRENKSAYGDDINTNIDEMIKLITKALNQMIISLENDNISDEELNKSINIETEINNFRDELKSRNIMDVKSKKYDYIDSVTYLDIITEMEKMGDYIINIVEALHHSDQ